MTITASAASVWDGTYFARIQDALGDSGASVTLLDNSTTATISGTPTGLGLKILAKQASDASSGSINKDTVTLSPAAQEALRKQQVALQLLSSDKKELSSTPNTKTTAASQAATTNTTATAANQLTTFTSNAADAANGTTLSSPATVSANDVTALAQEDPSEVIQDTLSAAQTALNDPNFFYAFANANSQYFASVVANMDPTTLPSFQAAFASKTLTIQNTADIPGSRAISQTVIGGTSESSGGAPGSEGYGQPPAGTAYLGFGFGVGSLRVSWSTGVQAATTNTA